MTKRAEKRKQRKLQAETRRSASYAGAASGTDASRGPSAHAAEQIDRIVYRYVAHVGAEASAIAPAPPEDFIARMQDEPAEKAQALAYEALEAMQDEDRETALGSARRALEIDPRTTDAHLTLAYLLIPERDQPTRLLEIAAMAAQDQREAILAAERGEVGNPFLKTVHRARSAAAMACVRTGDVDRAEIIMRSILATDPEAHEARLHLACLALGRRDLAGSRALLDRWWDHEPALAWARTLSDFLAGGRRHAELALRVARAAGYNWFDEDGDDRGRRLRELWQSDPAAKQWREDELRISTQDERLAAMRSYRAPLDALLGEEDIEVDTVVARTGLGLRDLPELARMARDHALHDHPDEASSQGPLHAVAVAAKIGGIAAVPMLIDALLTFEPDTMVAHATSHALSDGPVEALPQLITVLRDRERPECDRRRLPEIIERMALAHQPARVAAVSALAGELALFAANGAEMNAFLIMALTNLEAREHLALIERTYAEGEVDTFFAGLAAVRKEFANASRRERRFGTSSR